MGKLDCVRCGAKNRKWLYIRLEHGNCEERRVLLESSSPLCAKCSKAVYRAVVDALGIEKRVRAVAGGGVEKRFRAAAVVNGGHPRELDSGSA